MNDSQSRVGNLLVVVVLLAMASWWLFAEEGLRWPDVAGSRWSLFVVVVVLYAALCLVAIARTRRMTRPATVVDHGTILVAFATQTGFAEELATRTAAALRAAGHRIDLRPLAQVDAATLMATRVAFFVVATYGEGEPPDTSRRFAREVLGAVASLGDLRFGMLALGDRGYEHFCGFARTFEAWLTKQGADPLFARIDVDKSASAALAAWDTGLLPWTGDAAVQTLPSFVWWTVSERRRANPGSIGEPAFHVTLVPPQGEAPSWEAGDIAIVQLPDGQQREYSIASLPADGRIDLLVRQAHRSDGGIGFGARWLTSTLAIGASTGLRIRANQGFRLAGIAPSTPLILIGNGTGIAGLRAHLKARVAAGATRHWLFFGERHAAVDNVYGDELDAWQRAGFLERISYAFSRDTPRRVHVQDRVLEQRDAVAEWLAFGAVVLVCGNAAGMADGVDAALKAIVGDAALEDMAVDGRYRRDVY